MKYLKTLFIVRHIRYFFLYRDFTRWWRISEGRFSMYPNPDEVKYLNQVWKGEA